MSNRDIVVAAASGYQWPKLRPWARSLRQCGFEGRAFLILYGQDPEIIAEMGKLGIEVWHPSSNHLGSDATDVVVDRFYQKWLLLSELGSDQIDRVLSTDVQDVVFQSDPFVWLDRHATNSRLFATSEGIRYEFEDWGRANFVSSFGSAAFDRFVRSQIILNCGVWGGQAKYAAEAFLLVYLLGYGHPMHARGQRPSEKWTDQAALNLLIRTELVGNYFDLFCSESGFAAQLGTFLALGENSVHLEEPAPTFRNGEVFTRGGDKYAIVHQYTRVPRLAAEIRSRYALD